ncbi:hypothetical protein ACI8AC_11030 [Geodermatophilus sp. SYSU D00758]
MTTVSAPPRTAPSTVPARDRRAGAAALACAVVSTAVGATQLLFPQDTLAAIDPRTRVLLVATAALLWTLPLLHSRLAASARGPWGARVASAGTVLLGAGMVSSAVNGEDLAFFPAVAAAANALWFLGSVALAVSLWRAGRVPRAIAGLLVLLMPCTIVLSQLGGGIPAGAYLAVLGWVLLRGQLDSRGR